MSKGIKRKPIQDPLFFDIETGGFKASQSPLASISSGNKIQKVKSVYARPEHGAFYSAWSVKNVWEPIKHEKMRSEQEVMGKFLRRLKRQATGSELIGWNIGFEATPQSKGVQGFDIPYLVSRSQRYGMQKKFQKQFARLQIRDIGQEYAWKMATSVHASPALVEAGLHEQAGSFLKIGKAWAREQGVNPESEKGMRAIAKYMGTSGGRVAGWKQEMMYQAMFGEGYQAHVSRADVQAMMRMARSGAVGGPVLTSNQSVRTWADRALLNKLVNSAVSAPRASQAASGRYQDLIQQAAAWGPRSLVEAKGGTAGAFQAQFLSELEARVGEAGGSMKMVRQGFGMGREKMFDLSSPFKSGRAFRGLSGRRVGAFLGANKGKLAAAAGLGALWALEPGRIFAENQFSGFDDEHNTIEGLRHDGLGGRMRQAITEFGSGYHGPAQDHEHGFGETVDRIQSGLKTLNQLALLGSSTLAGFDRFGWKGAAGGLAAGALGITAVERASFRDTEGSLGKTLWNVGLQGVISSSASSLMAISTMRGSTVSKGLDRFAPKLTAWAYHTASEKSGIAARSLQAGGVGSLGSIGLSKIGRKIAPERFGDVAAKAFGSYGGSPSMLGQVVEAGSVKGITPSVYFGAVGKDLARGAGVGFIPGAAVGTAAWAFSESAERVQRRRKQFGGADRVGRATRIAPERRFKFFADSLEKYGPLVGTGHQRIEIPKTLLSEEELTENLGFVGVSVAIPEAGQSRFESFRNLDNLYHIHEHDTSWIMHSDRHAASTMDLKRYEKATPIEKQSLLEKAEIMVGGMPHVFTEGLPGAFYYAQGQLSGVEDMLPRVQKDTPDQYYGALELFRQGHVARAEKLVRTGNTVPGYDDAYNVIEGLTHGGSAQASRLKHTEFGSGWIGPVRKIFVKQTARKNYSSDDSRFSGRDDAYNTIEGLSHKGQSGISRKFRTEFGSGYQGPKEEESSTVYKVAMTAFQIGPVGLVYGSGVFNRVKEDLTGRATLYHGSSFKAAESIKKEGLMSSFSHQEGSLTRSVLGDAFADEHKGLIYLTHNRHSAGSYAAQAEAMASGMSAGAHQQKMKEFGGMRSLIDPFSHSKGISSFNVPLWQMDDKLRPNPEISKGFKAFMKKGQNDPLSKLATYFSLKSATVVEGDIGAKFVKGHADYQKQTLNEWVSYIKKHPGRFSRGLASATAGLTAVAMAGRYLFSGKDDAYNTVEGLGHGGQLNTGRHQASKTRPDYGFGSGWIKKALARGISTKTIAAGAFEQMGKSMPLADLERHLAKAAKAGTGSRQYQGLTKEIRGATGVTVGSGPSRTFWRKGEVLGKGSVGRVTKVYGPGGQVGAYKQGVGGDVSRAIDEAYREGVQPGSFPLMKSNQSRRILDGSQSGLDVNRFGRMYSQEITEAMKATGLKNAVGYEGVMTKVARETHGRDVIDVLAADEKGVVLEFLRGDAMTEKLLKKGTEKMRGTIGTMAQHLDPGYDQILRRGGVAVVADWGLAAVGTKPFQSPYGRKVANEMMDYQLSAERLADQIATRGARQKLAALHLPNQRRAGQMAKKGARGHNRMANSR